LGIRGKLILMATSITLIPCLLITGTIYFLVVKNLTQMITSDLQSSAEIKAQWLESWGNELMQVTQSSAENQVFSTGTDDEIRDYIRQIKDHWGAESVALVKPNGSSQINTDNRHASFKDEYVQTALKGELAFGGVGFSTITNNPVFAAAAPIKIDNNIIGVLAVTRNIQSVMSDLNKPYGYESRDSFILASNGMVMTEGRLGTQIRNKVITSPPARATTNGNSTYQTQDNREVIGVWLVSDKGWTIVEEVEGAEAMAPLNRNVPILLLIAGIVILVSLSVAVVISSRIAKPVRQVALAANRIAEGDLSADNKISITSKDEIGYLAGSFNAMIDNLRRLITKVKATANDLQEKSGAIKYSSDEVAISNSDQTNIVQQVSQAIYELAKASESIAISAFHAQQSGGNAAHEARESSIAVKEAINSLDAVKEAVGKLDVSSQRIGEIIAVIDNIADQTNLLSLNAAIESARAGEHGKSFTVVAEAVGDLAEKASNSTKEITTLIRNTQEQIQEAIEISETGAQKANSAVTALDNIVEQIDSVAAKIQEISAAGEQQSSRTEEMTTSMESLSATSEEVSASSQEMAASAKVLAELGRNLLNLVANFINT